MIGAVVGNPGTRPAGWSTSGLSGLTEEIIGFGSSFGLPYIDIRFSGIATSNGPVQIYPSAAVAASVGQSWAASFWFEAVDVSGGAPTSYRTRVAEINASLVTVNQNDANFGYTSGRVRVERIISMAQPDTTAVRMSFFFGVLSGNTYGFTLRLWAPQLELGAFSSPPILTTGNISTVAGNQQVITGLGTQLTTGLAGFVQFNTLGLAGIAGEVIFSLSDGTNSNAFRIEYGSSGALRIGTTVAGGGSILTPNLSSASFTGLLTCAFIMSGSQVSGRIVGQTQQNHPSPAVPIGLDRLALGGRGYTIASNIYGRTRKISLDYLAPGDDPAAAFANAYAKAQLAAAAP